MKKNIIKSLIILSPFATFAQPNSGATSDDLQLNTITTAVPFVSITPDSRAGGMGDAGTALSGNSNSIYWNTSVLNFAEDKSEISVSYTPWLRQLTNDIHLSYLSGYARLGERHAIAGGLRYFSLGEITFTDNNGNIIREDKPSEFEISLGYAFKTSNKTSVGINGKFIYSNLTGGLVVAGVNTKAGIAGATDISFTYFNDEMRKNNNEYTFAVTLNNIGNKIKYTDVGANAPGDFLPANIKIGNVYKLNVDKYNSLSVSFDIQKLLVPTPAIYDATGGIISGKSNDVGVISGMLQSFYDAPGVVEKDANGDYIQNADGSYQVAKGSKFKEEISEINLALGLEYWYNDLLAIRTGFFYENKNKGGRQYFNFGAGVKYNKFGFDISYLAALQRTNPLANTLRFSLRYIIGEKSNSGEGAPE